jgi:hypothetical protein
VVRHQLIEDLFKLASSAEYAEDILAQWTPLRVVMNNRIIPENQAFFRVFAEQGIIPVLYEPDIYRAAKMRVYRLYRFIAVRRFFRYNQAHELSAAGEKTVIFDLPYMNYFAALEPVLKQMLEDCRDRCRILLIGQCPLPGRPAGSRRGDRSFHPQKGLAGSFEGLGREGRYAQRFLYRMYPLFDEARGFLDEYFSFGFSLVCRDASKFYTLLKTQKPDLVVVGDDRALSCRSHVLLAKQGGIPVLEVQHGIMRPFFPIAPAVSDSIAAGGAYYGEVYVKYGADQGSVVVTGWPKFDSYAGRAGRLEAREGTVRTVLFATQPDYREKNLEVIDYLGRYFRDRQDIRVVVKTHPAESRDLYREVAGNFPAISIIEEKVDLLDLLDRCDLLVMIDSTIGLEAVMRGVPLICLAGRSPTNYFVDEQVAVGIGETAGLGPAIEKIVVDGEYIPDYSVLRERFIFAHLYLVDGKATERVFLLIMSTLGTGEVRP